MDTPPMPHDVEVINSQDVSAEERLHAARRLAKTHSRDLSAVCEIDLHIHSFFSDGYHSPAGRVFEAWRRRMKAVSVTDHDNFDGTLESLQAGEIFGLDVLPGIEFYTDRPGVEIIAHWPLAEDFTAWWERQGEPPVIDRIRRAKKHQLRRMVDRVPACMKRHGMEAVITDDDVRRYVRNGISTKGDISVILWQKYGTRLAALGIADDVKEFQAKYTTRDDELNVALDSDEDLCPDAFVQRVREWGGLPGLSHPTELRKKEGLGNDVLYEIIERLGGAGLQSVEVDGWRNGIDPESDQPHTRLFNEMRKRYNREHPDRLPLLVTNGSDDHNQPGEGLELGCGFRCNLDPRFGSYDRVEQLRERARRLKRR